MSVKKILTQKNIDAVNPDENGINSEGRFSAYRETSRADWQRVYELSNDQIKSGTYGWFTREIRRHRR
ncbi:MAG: hypothetical protein ACREH5_08185 [Candidatus Omnitrophota bacterium]